MVSTVHSCHGELKGGATGKKVSFCGGGGRRKLYGRSSGKGR